MSDVFLLRSVESALLDAVSAVPFEARKQILHGTMKSKLAKKAMLAGRLSIALKQKTHLSPIADEYPIEDSAIVSESGSGNIFAEIEKLEGLQAELSESKIKAVADTAMVVTFIL
jgi:hypothetical protein